RVRPPRSQRRSTAPRHLPQSNNSPPSRKMTIVDSGKEITRIREIPSRHAAERRWMRTSHLGKTEMAMRKLPLKLGELAVQSFATVAEGKVRGTVRANGSEEPVSTQCWTDPTADPTWQPAHTCPECAPMETPDAPCTTPCS